MSRSPRGSAWLVLVLGAAVIGLLTAVWGGQLLAARAELLQGRAAVEHAVAVLPGGALSEAQEAFTDAQGAFASAERRLSGTALRPLAVLPAVGRNVSTPRSLAEAGVLVSQAGEGLAAALDGLPDGLDTLLPRDGAIPLEPMRALAPSLEEAQALVGRADALVAGEPRSWLVGPVAAARDEFTVEVGRAAEALTTSATLSRHLPAFLGADGPRRYFLGAQNPAEVRGTGGLIGAFGILTAEDGRLDISEFRTIGVLTEAAPAQEDLAPPNEDYDLRYGRFHAAVHGSNINMSPDVPSAATAIENLYTAVTGEDLDGTILADPHLLRALLESTGPVHVPEAGEVDADSVVAFAASDQYAALAGEEDPLSQHERKELLGDVAAEVLRQFLGGSASHSLEALWALGSAMSDGRLLLHAADEEVQEAFVSAGVAGAFASPAGDFLAVVGNNAAGNKVDFFTERRVVYDVRLLPDGSAHGRLTLDLTNNAPHEGLHPAVLGPAVEGLEAGDNSTFLSVYCAPGCELGDVHQDGAPVPVERAEELGRPVFSRWVEVPSGESARLIFDWTLPGAWEEVDGRGVYRLTYQGQPTIPPTGATVRVHPPDGSSILSGTNSGADDAAPMPGQEAVWTGETGRAVPVEVTFAPSLGTRLAQTARDAVNRPLLELVRGEPAALLPAGASAK